MLQVCRNFQGSIQPINYMYRGLVLYIIAIIAYSQEPTLQVTWSQIQTQQVGGTWWIEKGLFPQATMMAYNPHHRSSSQESGRPKVLKPKGTKQNRISWKLDTMKSNAFDLSDQENKTNTRITSLIIYLSMLNSCRGRFNQLLVRKPIIWLVNLANK